MDHHTLDVWPEPRDSQPRFVNEPWLADQELYDYGPRKREPEQQEDNIRIYVPMDLNRESVLRRLQGIIRRYGEASEENESDFRSEVDRLIEQIGIYDQIWYMRTMRESDQVSTRQHSIRGIELVKEFICMLESIPDACAECFPFETIEELKKEFEC